jgi:cytochrome P450
MSDDVLRNWGNFEAPQGDDPYPLYAGLRDEAPVHQVTLPDGRDVWIVSRYQDARNALLNPLLFKDLDRAKALNPAAVPARLPPALFGRHMLSADPPGHTRLRSLVSRAFTPSRIEALRPRIQEITDRLLDEMAGHDPADLVAEFAFPLPITVICEMLGVPVEDRHRLRLLFTRLFGLLPSPEADGALRQTAADLIQYFTALLDDKRAHPAEDVLSGLIAACDGDERLTQEELLSTTFLLVLAGHETTVNLIANGTVALLRHPDQLAALRADESLIAPAVEEFLRYDGPVQHATFRFSAEPVEIGGVTIPAHQPVLILLAGANRDPERFADPDALDVRRSDNHHLAFGHGIHFCLGAPLARLEGQIAFRSLLRRFPDLRLAVPLEDVHWRYGLVLRSLPELPVHLASGVLQAPSPSPAITEEVTA